MALRLVRFSKKARLSAALEEVVLRRERDDVLAVRAERVPHEAHVEVARVVGDDDDVAVVRDVRAAEDARLHHLAVEEVLQLADEAPCRPPGRGSGSDDRRGARAARSGRARPRRARGASRVLHELLDVRDGARTPAAAAGRSAPKRASSASSSSVSIERVEAEVALQRRVRRRPPRSRRPATAAMASADRARLDAVVRCASSRRPCAAAMARTSSRLTLRVAVRGSGASYRCTMAGRCPKGSSSMAARSARARSFASPVALSLGHREAREPLAARGPRRRRRPARRRAGTSPRRFSTSSG